MEEQHERGAGQVRRPPQSKLPSRQRLQQRQQPRGTGTMAAGYATALAGPAAAGAAGQAQERPLLSLWAQATRRTACGQAR